jgi:hypothetical protein
MSVRLAQIPSWSAAWANTAQHTSDTARLYKVKYGARSLITSGVGGSAQCRKPEAPTTPFIVQASVTLKVYDYKGHIPRAYSPPLIWRRGFLLYAARYADHEEVQSCDLVETAIFGSRRGPKPCMYHLPSFCPTLLVHAQNMAKRPALCPPYPRFD